MKEEKDAQNRKKNLTIACKPKGKKGGTVKREKTSSQLQRAKNKEYNARKQRTLSTGRINRNLKYIY